MLMIMPFLFRHILNSKNATVLAKAASSNNIENTVETNIERVKLQLGEAPGNIG